MLTLPIEMLVMIFEHLEVLERPPIRAVCTLFKKVVDSVCVKELVVKPYWSEIGELINPDYVRSHRWYSTAEFADQASFVPRLPEGVQLKAILSKLRRLQLAVEFNASDLISLSTNLPRLEHLGLDHLNLDITRRDATSRNPGHHHVTLSNLKVLCICLVDPPGYVDFRLIFDSPVAVLCLGEFQGDRF